MSKSPLRVDGIGVKGVNLVVAPLEMDDSELEHAQNAEPYDDRGITGVTKRPAFRPVNSIPTGAIKGMVAVELWQSGAGNNLGNALSGAKGLMLVAFSVTPAWRATLDGGAVWAVTVAPTNGIAAGNI